MKINKHILTITIPAATLVIGCAQSSKNNLDWPEQKWCSQIIENKREGDGMDTIIQSENWKKTNDSLYIGTGSVTVNGKIEFEEEIQLLRRNNEWIYEVKVNDQNGNKPIPFVLKKQENGKFTFWNSEHDYPKVIQYQFLGDSLKAMVTDGLEIPKQKDEFSFGKCK